MTPPPSLAPDAVPLTEPPPATIPRLPKQSPDTAFDALRADAIRRAQGLSGQLWTDYNLHDPGVTLIEALAYGLTELAYRADFDVADLLCDERGELDYPRLALHRPQTVLPCRPTTLTDLRRHLLDRLPELDGVTITAHTGTPPAAPANAARAARSARPAGAATQPMPGTLTLVLDAAPGTDEAALRRQARHAHAQVRNLGEDLHRVRLVRHLPCRLMGEVEIGGARDPADIAAELVERCAAHLAAAVDFERVADALARGQTLDQVFDGPRTDNGQASATLLRQASQETLYLTDLIAVVRQVPGVVDVHWLALRPLQPLPGHDEPLPPATSALPWRNAAQGWSHALAPLDSAQALAELTLRRRGAAVPLSVDAVRRRVAELRAARRALRHGLRDVDSACPAPRGSPRSLPLPGQPPATLVPGEPPPATRHVALQTQFPAVWAVADDHLPSTMPPAHRGRVRQLQGYLLLFDQWLAHAGAQLLGLRRLFSTEPGAPPTYGWQLLGEGDVPGLGRLLDAGPPATDPLRPPLPPDPLALVAEVFDPFDNRLDRRNRLLDHLLALHGQTWSQNSLRQCAEHLGDDELALRLLANKVAFVDALLPLGRDRAGGIDLTRPHKPPATPWALQRALARVPPAGLQRQLALVLGLQADSRRPLVRALGRGTDTDQVTPPGGAALQLDEAQRATLRPLHLTAPNTSATRHLTMPTLREALRRVPLLRRAQLPAALRRCGAHHARWATRALPGGGLQLLVGPDEQQRHWPLADLQPGPSDPAGLPNGPGALAAQALALAQRLRQWLLHIDAAGDGLLLIEHVLLRPLPATPAGAAATTRPATAATAPAAAAPTAPSPAESDTGLPVDFHAQRLTVVFPAWTVRAQHRPFRLLAEESVRINTPAHLLAHCLWLEAATLQRVEAAWMAWRAARWALAQHADGPGEADARHQANQLAQALALQLHRLHLQAASQQLAPAAVPPGGG